MLVVYEAFSGLPNLLTAENFVFFNKKKKKKTAENFVGINNKFLLVDECIG